MTAETLKIKKKRVDGDVCEPVEGVLNNSFPPILDGSQS